MATPEFILALRSRIGHDPLWLSGVCAIVLRPWDGPAEVLLVRRSDDGTWTPVKGIMEPGETVPQAAVRECLEETGVRIEVDRLVSVGVVGPVRYDNGDVSTYLNLTVRARWVAGDAHVGDDESTEVGWFALDDLPGGMRAADLAQIRIALDNPADVVLEGLPR
ncbi:NUDIX domain-containing protein [Brooklawnia cerclae]|uniref:8-oxo-dGTP pyrophosphatase MutT (NUDIX family) n=1 Tax=Brooklawnia cerclae TaxID=349934 RepID=A0ABX0SC41_9ACTN|nr:NUDIX domain-containing protein [Brooklawnia cerclae]NIH55954.1 8-oxo-dGTP pyrophosphatase MutT (NUDIX family) [Brooklawnia cerclae]